jgi:SCY1-like protein 1
MGNASIKSKFKSLSDPILVEGSENKLWTLYDGVLQSPPDTNVSVFEYKGAEPVDKTAIAAVSNGVKTVRGLRHPSVLKYVDFLQVKEDGSHVLLSTEPVLPLRKVLPSLDFPEILLGIYQIGTALVWLHNQCGIMHDNVNLDAIYVTKDKQLRWVLGDFFFATPFNAVKKENIIATKDLRNKDSVPPEEQSENFEVVNIYARDAYGLARTIVKIFDFVKTKSDNKLDLMNRFMSDPTVREWLAKALNNDPSQRPRLEVLIQSKIFEQDSFTRIMLFFDDLRVKNNAEKDKFFRTLFSELRQLPPVMVKRRLVPRMLTLPFVTEPSASHFLPFLFTPKTEEQTAQEGATEEKKQSLSSFLGLLNHEDYQYYVLPFIRKCFTSRNRALRTRILQSIEYFMWDMPTEYVVSEMLDEVFLSLKDSNDDLVMFTMNALVLVAKYLAKLDEKINKPEVEIGTSFINHRIIRKLHHFACAETNIAVRSHALLCLMELWSLPKANKNVLLSALHYALYDPESYEVKLYSLNVILMHLRRFDPRELVEVILKSVLPLTLHERQEVRAKTAQVIRTALDYIAEKDLTNSNLGKVSRMDMPNPIIAALQPQFPKAA